MTHTEYFELCTKTRKIVTEAYSDIYPDWPNIGAEMFPNHKYDADKRFLNWKSNAKPFISHHRHYPLSISEEYAKEIYWSTEDSEVLGFLSRTTTQEYNVLPTNNFGECLECISYMFFKVKANKTYQLLSEAFKLCQSERGKITYDSFILTVRAVMRMDTIPNPDDSVRNRHTIIDNHMIDTFLHPIRKDRAKWFRSNEEFRAAFEYARSRNFEAGCWKQAIISHAGQSYSMKGAFEEMLRLNAMEQDSLATTPWSVFHSYFREDDMLKAEDLVRKYCRGNYDKERFMDAIRKILTNDFNSGRGFGQYRQMIAMSDSDLMNLFNFRTTTLAQMYELFGGASYYTEFKRQFPDHFNSSLGFLGHKIISTPQKLRKDLATFHNSLVSADKELIAPVISQQEFHNQKLKVLLSLSDDDLWYVIGRRNLHKSRADYVWCDTFPSIDKWNEYMMDRPHISGEDYCHAPAAFRNMVQDFFRYGGSPDNGAPKPIQTKRSSREEWIVSKLAQLKA